MNLSALSLHCFNSLSQVGAKTLSRLYAAGVTELWLNGNLPDFQNILKTSNLTWYKQLEEIDRPAYLEQESKYLQKQNINLITIQDKDYPTRLSAIDTPPSLLYVKGDISGLKNALAVIGTRKYSSYGEQVVNSIITELSQAGIPIISGLALGIDGLAHIACLRGQGKTVAVLGGGLDDKVLYPKAHTALAKKIILHGGALVSEFAPLKSPRPESFLLRNRIVSGLAQGVLVIEAPLKSGTMTTVKFGLEQGRDIFAIPGDIFAKNSEGTNYLIQQGAYPVTKAQEILAILGISRPAEVKQSLHSFNDQEKIIIQYLVHQPANLEQLAQSTSTPILDLMATLSLLELKDVIAISQEAKYYLKIKLEQ